MKLPDEVRRLFAEYGRRGGEAAARRMSPSERKASARKAAAARWKGHTGKTKPRRKKPPTY